MVVSVLIPNEAGFQSNSVSTQHDQISRGPRGIRRAGSLSNRLTGICAQSGSPRKRCIGKGRSACNPIRSSELRQRGLAGFRHRVFAQQRFRSKDCGSSSRDLPSLGKSSRRITSLEMKCLMFKSTAFIAAQCAKKWAKGFPLSLARELPPRLVAFMEQLAKVDPPEDDAAEQPTAD